MRSVVTLEGDQQHRRSIRLTGYDYGQIGAYFITLCTHDRVGLFGDIDNGEVRLSEMGQVVNEEWAYAELLRPHIMLDEYILMPNHLHAIVVITNRNALPAHRSRPTLGTIVRGFKAATTGRFRTATRTPHLRVWQRNYYEHVVRNDADLQRIRNYIVSNPARWAEDEENPARIMRVHDGNTKTCPRP